jgi:DNA-binding PadR family transcriptional regulator
MRKAGWIDLRIAGERQKHLYCLTPEGERLLEKATPFWQRATDRLAEAYGKLESADLAQGVSILDELAKAAQVGLELRTSNHSQKRAASAT